ncbi:MAG: transcriptional regulator, LysR family [Bacilli bacterium]|nr:transcriptional regulator, LysR family [Bacilli bacterium]
MSKAARTMAFSQSSVSFRIANLEAELGAVLFRRNRSGTYLTEAGRRFYYYALYALSALEGGRRAVQGCNETPNDSVPRIGISGSLSHIILPAILEATQTGGSPQAAIRTGESLDLAIMTAAGNLHFAYINSFFPFLPLLKSVRLFEEQIVFIGPKNRGLTRNHSIHYYLRSAPFILLKQGMPLRELIEKELFTPLHQRPNTLVEVDSSHLIRIMVAEGSGYSLLPGSSLWMDGSDDGIEIIPLPELSLKQSFYCVYPSDLHESHHQVLNQIGIFIDPRIQKMKNKYINMQ